MEFGYNAQYKQPFTLEEAAGLDVEVITEEIARLQHSIAKLRETQEVLAEELKTEPDPELQLALEENNSSIARGTYPDSQHGTESKGDRRKQ
ncbi:hypothetical protein BKA70DRAFT_1420297 [Coprinopsis sp. MPI-PUGE-AT-0042]|nr:hypothetical protein BKA70DRAFT_1420297 [Coprinopsis sp. MPI-PUGE-AT-0042]